MSNGKITADGMSQIGDHFIEYDGLTVDIEGQRAFLTFEGKNVYEWILPKVVPGDGLRIGIKGKLPVKLEPT